MLKHSPLLPCLLALLLCPWVYLGPVAAQTHSEAAATDHLVRLSDVRQGSLMFQTQDSEHDGLWRKAPTLQTDVRIMVTGPIARTVLKQRFSNPSHDWAEATYAFPLPEKAAVDHMRMRVGERIIEGEIQEKQQARKSYEQAKKQGKRSALLEQHRPNLFTTQVANIPPQGEIEIELEYQQELLWRDGEFSLRFPMAITPRYSPANTLPQLTAEPLQQARASVAGWSLLPGELENQVELAPAQQGSHNPTRIQVKLQAGFETGPVHSHYHAIYTQPHEDHIEIQLVDAQTRSDRDFLLRWSPRDQAAVQAAYFVEQRQDKHYGLLMLMPPQQAMKIQHSRARELIFVVDTSGSMGGESIRAARQGLLSGLDQLNSGDSFNLIEFNNEALALFPQPRAASTVNLDAARRWTHKLNAHGGTEMRKALQLAFSQGEEHGSQRLRQIVFITDGAVSNESQLMQLIHASLGDTRLFTVGIGSAPNAHFMTEAAHFGRGSFSYIANANEVATTMRRLFRQLDHPALTDIELQLPSSADALPSPIPDLYLGEPISIVMQLETELSQAQLTGQIGLRPWQQALDLQSSVSQGGIATLWARRKMTDWSRQGQRGLAQETVRKEILQLALDHHLVSRYTSLVAVDKTPERELGADLKQHQLNSNLPAGMSVPMAQGSTSSWLLLIKGSLLLGLAIVLSRKRRSQA